jgi:nicotinamidase-related amidase
VNKIPPDSIHPRSTAVVVVDVQHDFCALDGAFARNGMDVSAAQSILSPLATLLAAARDVGTMVVYLRFVEDVHGHVISAAYDRQRYKAGASLRYCTTETGRAVAPEVRPDAEDPVVDKVRASGFFNTALDTILRCRGVQTILLTGMATDSCVLATAIDATARDYDVVLVEDCLASFSSERHEAAMKILAYKHPRLSGREVVRLLRSKAGELAE